MNPEDPKLTGEVKEALIAGLERELAARDEAPLTERRDAALVDLLKLKAAYRL
jgi:carnitine 3-dehydrogenase